MNKVCLYCKKPYKGRKENKYCSTKCRDNSNKKSGNCRKCKKYFDKLCRGYCHNCYNKESNANIRWDIDRETYEFLKKNKCEICGSNKVLHLDHCHETGHIRGTLCFRCNGNLGWIEKFITEIFNYIDSYKEEE